MAAGLGFDGGEDSYSCGAGRGNWRWGKRQGKLVDPPVVAEEEEEWEP